MNGDAPLLRITNLVKHFPITRVTFFQHRVGSVKAVDDVSFEAEAGKMLVLLGPSGCGKSTTLRLIAGLEVATTGRIAIGLRQTGVLSGLIALMTAPKTRRFLRLEAAGLGHGGKPGAPFTWRYDRRNGLRPDDTSTSEEE